MHFSGQSRRCKLQLTSARLRWRFTLLSSQKLGDRLCGWWSVSYPHWTVVVWVTHSEPLLTGVLTPLFHWHSHHCWTTSVRVHCSSVMPCYVSQPSGSSSTSRLGRVTKRWSKSKLTCGHVPTQRVGVKTKQTLQNTLHAKCCAKRELKAHYSISGPFSVYRKFFWNL